MEDKATIEIDWVNKIVGVPVQLRDFSTMADKAVETSNALIIAQLAGKYAHDLMKLSPEDLREEYLLEIASPKGC